MTVNISPENVARVVGLPDYSEGDCESVKDEMLKAMSARLAEVEAELDAKHEQITDILADQECACGYDKPTDVCLGHLTYHRKTVARAEAAEAKLAASEAREAKLREALEVLVSLFGVRNERD